MQAPATTLPDHPSKILNLICFLCPPLGLVVYLSLVGKLPRQAQSAGLWGARGVGTLLVGFVLYGAGLFVMTALRPATPTTVELDAATNPPAALVAPIPTHQPGASHPPH